MFRQLSNFTWLCAIYIYIYIYNNFHIYVGFKQFPIRELLIV